jgi:hypothetical protein
MHVSFVEDYVYPADSHSVHVLNYASFQRPPVRDAEPVQNLLGSRPARYVKTALKAYLFDVIVLFSFGFSTKLYQAFNVL